MIRFNRLASKATAVTFLALLGACSNGKVAVFVNPDPAMRQDSTIYAADAAKRSYETDAPRGGKAPARAEYHLMVERFDLVNLADSDWTDVEVWVNQKYVVHVPVLKAAADERLSFNRFFDRDGHAFDTDGGKNPVRALEICKDGTMYTVTATLE